MKRSPNQVGTELNLLLLSKRKNGNKGWFHLAIITFLIFLAGGNIAAQQNDTTVDPLLGNRRQEGQVNFGETKKFVADFITALGRAPERAIYLRKTFTPPSPFLFRPFRPEEKQPMEWYLEHPLKIRIDPYIATLIWEYWENEVPQYVDFWFSPEEAIIYGIPESTFQNRAIFESPGRIVVTACFADSNTAAHFPLRCDGNLATPPGEGAPMEFHWAAAVAGGIDLDIDNDNNSTAGVFGGPDRDLEKEDRWESADKDDKGNLLPGKYIPVNDGDSDEDKVPGFADFNEITPAPGRVKNQFVLAKLDVSNTEEMIVWKDAKIKFKYSCSQPPSGTDTTLADGMIRIWTKDADKARNKDIFANGGDFIPGDDREFYADRLFKDKDGKRVTEIPLYIEGIGKGTTSGLIEVKFSPKGDTTWMPDEVKVTVPKLTLANEVWWNGYNSDGKTKINLSRYPVSSQLKVEGVSSGTFVWSIIIGSDRVELAKDKTSTAFSSTITEDNDNSIYVYAKAGSVKENDITIQLQFNGLVICDRKMTVYSPKSVKVVNIKHKRWRTSLFGFSNEGYKTILTYRLLSQFDKIIPQYPVGELFSSNWYSVIQNKWKPGDTGGYFTNDNGQFTDTISVSSPNPDSQYPNNPLGTVLVRYITQQIRSGKVNATKNVGLLLRTNIVREYLDHGSIVTDGKEIDGDEDVEIK